jgi:hypothetical protein
MLFDAKGITSCIISQVHKTVKDLKEYENWLKEHNETHHRVLLACMYIITAKWECSGRKGNLKSILQKRGLDYIFLFFEYGEFEKIRSLADLLYDEKFIRKLEKNSRKICESLAFPSGTPYIV